MSLEFPASPHERDGYQCQSCREWLYSEEVECRHCGYGSVPSYLTDQTTSATGLISPAKKPEQIMGEE